jgi:hypothetical protein
VNANNARSVSASRAALRIGDVLAGCFTAGTLVPTGGGGNRRG